MKPLRYAVLAGLGMAAGCAPASAPPYNLRLTEPDQELDGFSGRFQKMHTLSAQLRGASGAGSTLYWASPDGRELLGYQRGRLRWRANVSQALAPYLPDARLTKFAMCSTTIFVFTTGRGYAEVNRATGTIAGVGVDP